MRLYGFGSNGSGQLGIGDIEDTNVPQLCHLTDDQEWPSPIRTIRGGGSHTLVLLESGQLFASGSVSHNKTGIKSSIDTISKFCEIPNTVFGGSRVKLCTALWEASIVVTNDNQIFTFGQGSKGELGVAPGSQGFAHKLDDFCPPGVEIVDLSSGMDHTIVVLSNGEAHGWGNGRKGQLGEPAGLIWKPRPIDNIGFAVVRGVCGRDFSYLVGHAEDGSHTVLGSDKWKVMSTAPEAVRGWKDIAASWGSIFVLSKSGDFVAWGRNDHGQLGHERRPAGFLRMAAGSEHGLAITDSGSVASWGWGEHGNCGPGTDSSGDVKGWWNELPGSRFDKDSKVTGISAGCATSFVWTKGPKDFLQANQ
ncbi:MAG: hypothetical protein Q9222_007178 [Ikaeria aurantiellina]